SIMPGMIVIPVASTVLYGPPFLANASTSADGPTLTILLSSTKTDERSFGRSPVQSITVPLLNNVRAILVLPRARVVRSPLCFPCPCLQRQASRWLVELQAASATLRIAPCSTGETEFVCGKSL